MRRRWHDIIFLLCWQFRLVEWFQQKRWWIIAAVHKYVCGPFNEFYVMSRGNFQTISLSAVLWLQVIGIYVNIEDSIDYVCVCVCVFNQRLATVGSCNVRALRCSQNWVRSISHRRQRGLNQCSQGARRPLAILARLWWWWWWRWWWHCAPSSRTSCTRIVIITLLPKHLHQTQMHTHTKS